MRLVVSVSAKVTGASLVRGSAPSACPDRGAVGADLSPVAAHLGCVEAHCNDRVGALRLRLFHHAIDHLLATVDERLRHPFQLAADYRLQSRAELRTDVARPDGESENLPERLDDLV